MNQAQVIQLKNYLDNGDVVGDIAKMKVVKADKTLNVHLERIAKGRFEKSEINALTKMITSARFAKPARKEAIKALVDLVFDHAGDVHVPHATNCYCEALHFKSPKKITSKQTKFGKAWLKDYFFKKNGEARSGKRTEDVGTRVLSIAKSVVRFEFIGVITVTNTYGHEITQSIPIYRAYNRKGEYFDYAPIQWSAPIIIEGL